MPRRPQSLFIGLLLFAALALSSDNKTDPQVASFEMVWTLLRDRLGLHHGWP